jgi:hypothetical protein
MAWGGVKREDIPTAWPQVEPLVQSILDSGAGELDARDIYIELLAGKLALWIIGRDPFKWGIVLTRIVDYPRYRVCFIEGIACRNGYSILELRKEFEPVLEQYGREEDCFSLRAAPHVKGFWNNKGWEKLRVVLEKKL